MSGIAIILQCIFLIPCKFHFKLPFLHGIVFPRQLPSLVNLQVLNLRNTHRNQQNLPPSLEMIPNLAGQFDIFVLIHRIITSRCLKKITRWLFLIKEIDISENELTRVPDCIYNVVALRRLNLSKNLLTEFDIKGIYDLLSVLSHRFSCYRCLFSRRMDDVADTECRQQQTKGFTCKRLPNSDFSRLFI